MKGCKLQVAGHKKIITLIFVILSGLGFQSSVYCAESEIITAQKAFLEGHYEKAIHESETLIDARSRQRDELYYLKGLSELKLNKFNDSRRTFETLLSKYPRSKRGLDARLGVGDAYFLEGRYNEAAKEYNTALSAFPKDKNISVVYQKLEECSKKTGAVAAASSSLPIQAREGASAVESNFTSRTNFVPQEVPRGEQTSVITVQVGSFKNKRNAENMSQKLHRLGYESFVEIPTGAGDRLYRVKVGRLNSRQEAETLAGRLKKSGYKVKICGN
jgi:tetratricopeptide (TPR) repeat protein